jgi:hypothetical protein
MIEKINSLISISSFSYYKLDLFIIECELRRDVKGDEFHQG